MNISNPKNSKTSVVKAVKLDKLLHGKRGIMGNFASYEKVVTAKVVRTKHIVRIRLNEQVLDVIRTLKNVPQDAVVTMLVDDELEGYGEIVFEEEKPL